MSGGSLVVAFHAAEKTRPLLRKALQGAANLALRQKIAGGSQNSFLLPADVFEIVFALLHVSPILVFVAQQAKLAVAIRHRQREVGFG